MIFRIIDRFLSFLIEITIIWFFKKNIDVIFEKSIEFGVIYVLMLSKHCRFCISGVVFWKKLEIF